VHAGPIQDVAYLIGQAGFHPLLTMSWGFDLMKDAYLTPLKRWQTRWTLAHSDMLTLDCQATAERAVSFGFPRERICVFPWGVDLTKFSPQSSIVPGKAWRQQQGWSDAIVLLCFVPGSQTTAWTSWRALLCSGAAKPRPAAYIAQ